MEKVKAIIFAVGRIGSGVARLMVNKESMEIVGAIDIDKEKVGRDLGEVAGVGERFGIIVSNEPEAVLSKAKADIIIHTTNFTSQEEVTAQQLMALETEG